MIGAERKYRIIEYVKENKVATIFALAKEFNVHEATIRRDLTEIEQEGHIKRTHGGVVLNKVQGVEASFSERTKEHLDEKSRIGKLAASLVEDGDHIILDSGTTTIHIAKNLVHHKNLFVVTNDINIAAELRDAPGVTVIVTGGTLYKSSFMLNGLFTDQNISTLHVQKAFIGTPAIHARDGLTHPEAYLIPAKQGMIKASNQIIVVADHTKVGCTSLHTIVPISAVHSLITGKEVTESQIGKFKEAGIDIIIA